MRSDESTRVYIHDAFCISPQQTYDEGFFQNSPKVHAGNRYTAIEPPYGTLIPGGLLRRMGKAVRMGVGAGLPLINRNTEIEGIILGTANGGLEDCLKFLNQIVDYEEGTLTPTNFVQSTPNAVAGSLALMSKNTGYNSTHVNKGLSFEGALLDALLLLNEGKAQKLLLGGIEEISDYNYNIDDQAGLFKKGKVTSETLLNSGTLGTVCGEGATIFVISTENNENALAEIVDTDQVTYPDEASLEQKIKSFLNKNGLDEIEVDTLILGNSGDCRSDHWYENVKNKVFSETQVLTYKDLSGDYPTSSSFALWIATQVISGKSIPGKSLKKMPKNILIYNHYRGIQHGLILVKSPY
jgi:hypothetical protein